MMRAGQQSYIPGVGYIRITAVEEIELAELTDADARRDGFDTADELRSELLCLYRDQLDTGYRSYRVCFYVLPTDEQQRARERRLARQSQFEKSTESVRH